MPLASAIGEVGEQSHEDAADAGGERGGGDGAFERNAGAGEDAGIDEEDVTHREEGGDGAAELAGDGGVAGMEVEEAFEVVFHDASGVEDRRGWCGIKGCRIAITE